MMTLKGKQDNFRLLLPDDFICEEINEKYSKILKDRHSFYTRPIDFVNETIQSVEVLGFSNATVIQQQPGVNNDAFKIAKHKMMYPDSEYNYRAAVNPLTLIDKTLNINFRHTLGFVNYFILFENFFWQYDRDTQYKNLPDQFSIDIMNQNGSIYSKVVIEKPIINGMDMLSMNYTQPIASSQTFKVEFKYSNIDYCFIDTDESEIL